jgi:hypothetical protein
MHNNAFFKARPWWALLLSAKKIFGRILPCFLICMFVCLLANKSLEDEKGSIYFYPMHVLFMLFVRTGE